MAKLRPALSCSVSLVLFMVLAGRWLPAPRAQTTRDSAPLSQADWREDVRYFAKELPKRHKNLYHATTREQFERAVAELDAALPSLQDHQIIVRLQQIAATVGDGHTGVHLPSSFRIYPISLYQFGRDLRVVAAAKDHQGALGTRLVKVAGMGIDEVLARVRTCFPSAANENEWYVMGTTPAFIVRPEVLHALGVVPDLGSAPFTFEDDQGRQVTLTINPIALPAPAGGNVSLGLMPAAASQPLYRQKPGEPFWFTYLPDSQTTYVSFRKYGSLGAHAKALFAFIDGHPTKRLVIDMRQNGGGDFFEGRKHMIAPLKQRPALNQKGRLFVVIGRNTFSAAMANAVDFRNETNAILVGEPIGERPNSYSENDEMTLPHSRVVVSYSTKYYKFVEEDVPAVMPDERIDPDWPAFLAGRDPVMDWILRSVAGDRALHHAPDDVRHLLGRRAEHARAR
jgi:hypothetical protein